MERLGSLVRRGQPACLCQYNEYLDKYVVLYADGNNDIQMRIADEPEGL